MTEIPQAATDAAAIALARFPRVGGSMNMNQAIAKAALEAAAPHLRAAEPERLAAGIGCITPCDDDCELQPDGCHELHQIPRRQTHRPQFCADIRAAIGAAVAAERERIAVLAEQEAHQGPKLGIDRIAMRLFAARIRAEAPGA